MALRPGRLVEQRGRRHIFVAATNAPREVQLAADFVCDGVDDEVQIKAARDLLPVGGGIIELSEGDFTCGEDGVAGYAILLKSNVRLTGQGMKSTRITFDDAVDNDVQVIRIEGFSWVEIDHMEIDGNEVRDVATFDVLGGCISAGGGSNNFLHHLFVHEAMGDGMDTDDDDDLIIADCIVEDNNGSGIFPSSGNAFSVTISDCHTSGNAAGRTSRNAGIAVRAGVATITGCQSEGDENGFWLEPQTSGSVINISACTVTNSTDTSYVLARGTGSGAGTVNMVGCSAVENGLKVLDIQCGFANFTGCSFNAGDVGGTVVECLPSTAASFATVVRMVNCVIRDTFGGGKSNTLVDLNATNNVVDFRMAHCTISGGDTDSVKTTAGAYVELFDCDIPDTKINIATDNNRFIYNQFGIAVTDTGTGNVFIRNVGHLTEGEGTDTQSGDGAVTVFNIAHGLDITPTAWSVTPGSADADGTFFVTADGTNLIITYATAPVTGTNNLDWAWIARGG